MFFSLIQAPFAVDPKTVRRVAPPPGVVGDMWEDANKPLPMPSVNRLAPFGTDFTPPLKSQVQERPPEPWNNPRNEHEKTSTGKKMTHPPSLNTLDKSEKARVREMQQRQIEEQSALKVRRCRLNVG